MKKNRKQKGKVATYATREAIEFQKLTMEGFRTVIDGKQSLEEWLVDLDPVAKKYRCRLVIVMWPASAPLGADLPTLNLDGWLCDLDFCFQQPPYSVSVLRQPGPPEWMSKPEAVLYGRSQMDQLEAEATEPGQFLSAEIGREFEAYQDHQDWDRFRRQADAACARYSGAARMLFTPDRVTISMLVGANASGDSSPGGSMSEPDTGYTHIGTYVCKTDEEFRELVAEIEKSRKEPGS